jgi:hypothetical protein
MMRISLQATAALLCAVLAGCTSSPPPPAVVAAPSAGPVSFDGVYYGTTQLVRGSGMSCGTRDMLTLRVANNAFRYTLNQPQVVWQATQALDVAIAPDGSFQSQSGTASMRGSVGGGHMQGEINGDACGFAFEADNSGTW